MSADQTERPLADVIEELRGLLTKATPGPWPITETGDGKRIIIGKGLVEGPNGYEVAEVYSDDCPREVAEANAHLIAALHNNADLLLSAASRVSAPPDWSPPVISDEEFEYLKHCLENPQGPTKAIIEGAELLRKLYPAASRVSAPAFDPKCRHGCKEAVGLYSLPQGCPCFDDKEQWLCEQHLVKLRNNGYEAIPIFERLRKALSPNAKDKAND